MKQGWRLAGPTGRRGYQRFGRSFIAIGRFNISERLSGRVATEKRNRSAGVSRIGYRDLSRSPNDFDHRRLRDYHVPNATHVTTVASSGKCRIVVKTTTTTTHSETTALG